MKRIAFTTLLILATTGGIASAQYYQQRPSTTYQTYGNQTYGSDGTTIQRYGNQSYINHGNGSSTVCQHYGQTTYCN